MPTTKAFDKLFENVKETYLGDPVPKRFQKDYGKIYNKKDIKPLAIRIAKSRGIKIDIKEAKKKR